MRVKFRAKVSNIIRSKRLTNDKKEEIYSQIQWWEDEFSKIFEREYKDASKTKKNILDNNKVAQSVKPKVMKLQNDDTITEAQSMYQ